MQRAVAKLYRDMVLNGLVSPDLSLPNLYFKKVGDEWVAGILDVDHIVNFRKPGRFSELENGAGHCETARAKRHIFRSF